MSFKDALKKSILDSFTAGSLSASMIAITIGIAVILGLYIYFIYRLTMKESFYSRGFNKALALLPLITSGILTAMQGNLVISLGMVGALSIIRFRTAVKNPIDLTFLFWSISVGIVTGASMYMLAAIISLAFTGLIFFLDILPSFRSPCLLVISAENSETNTEIFNCLKKYSRFAKLRNRSITKHGMELILEIKIRQEAELVKELSLLEGITSVNLLSHDGFVRF